MRPLPTCLIVALVFALSLAFAPSLALAQGTSETDRLRDALRQTTVDLRALQDSQAAMQAKLDAATKQRDLLQAQVDTLTAKLAATPPTPRSDPALAQAQSRADALSGQVQSLSAGLAKWQAAYQDAAGVARAKNTEAATLAQTAKQAQGTAALCSGENAKLMAVADEILHLYSTAGFRRILIGSYEPLLGLEKVKLQNIVQDYEDKIRDQQFYPPAAAR